VIQELDSKQRKISSFRGFFLYTLEIMQTEKNYEILITNLQPFFWRKVKNIIRQNKKGALLEFLFGYNSSRKEDGKSVDEGSNPRIKILEDQIENLQNQVTLLQQKVINLEAKLGNSKYPLSDPSHPSESSKTIQQDDYTFEAEKGPYLTENQSQIKNPTYQTKYRESKSVSYAPKIDFKAVETSEQYLPLNQEKGPNDQNFITLSKISEEE